MIKKITFMLLAATTIFAMTGCAKDITKIPVEDPLVLNVCAEQIKVLHDPFLTVNSREKFEAAQYIAKHVDFSFARNVSTLDKIFLAQDAKIAPSGNEFVFSYPYRDKSIQFRFIREGGVIYSASVVER